MAAPDPKSKAAPARKGKAVPARKGKASPASKGKARAVVKEQATSASRKKTSKKMVEKPTKNASQESASKSSSVDLLCRNCFNGNGSCLGLEMKGSPSFFSFYSSSSGDTVMLAVRKIEVIDDSLVPEHEELEDMDKHKPITKKSKNNTMNGPSVHQQPSRGKRVVAPMQPSRLTWSGKVVRPQVSDASTQDVHPIQPTSEVPAAVTQDDNPNQPTSQVAAAVTQDDNRIQPTSEVLAAVTQDDNPIQHTSEVPSTVTQDNNPIQPTSEVTIAVTQEDNPVHRTSEAPAIATHQDGPTLTMHTEEGIGQHIDQYNDDLDELFTHGSSMNQGNETVPNQFHHTMNDTIMNESINNDTEGLEEFEMEWTRGPNIGRGLERMSHSKRGKLPVVIEPGNIRPNSVNFASKFATDCNIVVRDMVPIFPKWKDYMNQKGLIRFYISKIGSKFNMETTAGPIKKACVAQLKRAIRQQRYRLKHKYYDPYPLKLVENWKDEKKWLRSTKRNHQMRLTCLKSCTTARRKALLLLYKQLLLKWRPSLLNLLTMVVNRSLNDAVSEVLVDKTKKNQFLRNVGMKGGASASSASRQELQEELVI